MLQQGGMGGGRQHTDRRDHSQRVASIRVLQERRHIPVCMCTKVRAQHSAALACALAKGHPRNVCTKWSRSLAKPSSNTGTDKHSSMAALRHKQALVHGCVDWADAHDAARPPSGGPLLHPPIHRISSIPRAPRALRDAAVVVELHPCSSCWIGHAWSEP